MCCANLDSLGTFKSCYNLHQIAISRKCYKSTRTCLAIDMGCQRRTRPKHLIGPIGPEGMKHNLIRSNHKGSYRQTEPIHAKSHSEAGNSKRQVPRGLCTCKAPASGTNEAQRLSKNLLYQT